LIESIRENLDAVPCGSHWSQLKIHMHLQLEEIMFGVFCPIKADIIDKKVASESNIELAGRQLSTCNAKTGS
jgi:hypothetical protein